VSPCEGSSGEDFRGFETAAGTSRVRAAAASAGADDAAAFAAATAIAEVKTTCVGGWTHSPRALM